MNLPGKNSPSRRAQALTHAYELMRAHFGHRHWWPAETPFEVCVGAILTQNTNWANVTRAIGNLQQAGLLEPRSLWALPESQLAELIRPAGYYNIKARRLRAFLRVLVEEFHASLPALFSGETPAVRARLLAINGIGPETADSMLLYAGGHLSFVVDAYTQRIFRRHGWARPKPGREGYHAVQKICAAALPQPPELDYWQDYHAQLVAVGNRYCRPRNPQCELCPLKALLPRRNFQCPNDARTN